MERFILNPFRFEGVVTGKDFCNRDADVEQLLHYMTSGNNIIISMKRRVGKTSLIQEIITNHSKAKHLVCGYVDIYGITSIKELYLVLKDEVETLLSFTARIGIDANRLKDAFSEADIAMTLSADPRVTIEFSGSRYEELIKKLLLSLQSYAQQNNLKVVFAIDEFQKIASLPKKDVEKIETNIRTAMQNSNRICFVLSGSNQTMLDSMFQQNRPLYRQGVHYILHPINKEVFYQWASQRFRHKEITIDPDAFDYIYEVSNTEAKIVQQICFELFSRTEPLHHITVEDVRNIITIIYKNNSEIASKFNMLKLNEQKMLKIIALEKEVGITVSPLLQEYGISQGSVSNILKKMVEKYILVRQGSGGYDIVDTELKLWIVVNSNAL